MGQYYRAYVESENQKGFVESWDFDNGMKLMEHSWVGNEYCNAVMYLIEDNPMRVGWVGDYSKDCAKYGGGQNCPADIYDFCWGGSEDEDLARKLIPEPPDNFLCDREHEYKNKSGTGYLVNHDTGQYVDLDKYMLTNEPADKEWGGIPHPLPLLTCVGNGMGGGDYHSGRAFDMVGAWFGDVLEYTKDKPVDAFEDVTDAVLFKEGR